MSATSPSPLSPGDRVLVAFASRHGATAGIARGIHDSLAENGVTVELSPMADVDTLYPYDAYVLGSAVYMGTWLHEAREFLAVHHELIVLRPTWLFSSGPIGDPSAPGVQPFDPSDLLTETHARDHQLFGGRLDRAALNRRERLLSRLVRSTDGDFRDWDSVTSWAAAIAGSLTAGVATV